MRRAHGSLIRIPESASKPINSRQCLPASVYHLGLLHEEIRHIRRICRQVRQEMLCDSIIALGLGLL